MRNIFRIFLSDARRISTNVVAVVVIIGLSVIPCLYAWFNILSNWDPYGEEATSNLSVVVASCDEGIVVAGVEFNVGDLVVNNLKENDTIKWSFVDTENEAKDLVESGDSYAALVIEEDFTQNLISFLGGDITNPTITYYENEKKNAIAPKITGKVKTTVQEEINSAFISTLAQSLVQLSDYIVSTDAQTNLTGSVLERLNSLNSDLSTYITILDSYISVMDSAASLAEATETVTDQLDDMLAAGRSLTNGASAAAETSDDAVSTVSDTITYALDQIANQIDTLRDTTDAILDAAEETGELTDAQIAALKVAVTSIKSGYDTAISSVRSQYGDTVSTNADQVDTDFDTITADLDDLQEKSDVTQADVTQLQKELTADFDTIEKSIDSLNQTYQDTVEPQLNTTMRSIQTSLLEIQELLNFSSDSLEDVASSLGSYPDMMAFGRDQLQASKDEAEEMSEKLTQLIDDMTSISGNDQYNRIITLIESDPEMIADFISSPVNLDEEAIYPIANNGSATAPFYIVLSIWFGALILIAIIHTTIQHPQEFVGLKNYQSFFGRYVVFFLVGQLQTLITILGCLLYVGIQCEHPLLLYLAAAFTSFTFTLFMYSLAYAFGNVGEAVAVVLMVIQVAGSGGTFPVEVLPKVFQYLYEYMPFAHGMNAIRECIGGLHEYDYLIYLAGLLPYIAASIVLGLVVSIPFKKWLVRIDESKEKTDLLV